MKKEFQRQLTEKTTFSMKAGIVTVDNKRAGFVHCLTEKFEHALAYITPRKRKQHFFRMFRGYGCNRELLQFLHDRKITHILILENDQNQERQLLSELSDWLTLAFEYQKDGYEQQKILPEAQMTVVEGAL